MVRVIFQFSLTVPDVALKQTVNKDSKTKGGIIWISDMEESRDG